MIWLDVQRLRRNTIGKLMTKKSEEEVCGQASLNGQKTWYLCPVRMLTKGCPQQRTTVIIKWIGWPVLYMPVSLFPQSPLSLSNDLTNKVPMVAEMKVTRGWRLWRWGSLTCTFTHQDQPGCGHHRAPHQPAHETNTELLMWHQPPERSAGYLVAGWLHCTVATLEVAAFCSYWNRHWLWIQICLSCMTRLPTMSSQNAFPLSWYSVQHCF